MDANTNLTSQQLSNAQRVAAAFATVPKDRDGMLRMVMDAILLGEAVTTEAYQQHVGSPQEVQA